MPGLQLKLNARLGRAGLDPDARAVIQRAVAAGSTLLGPTGTDYRGFVNSFIKALKRGGAAGDCYALCDAIYLPIVSVRDSANKISKLLDCARQKGTGFGTGGYYDASQSTASLQQVLTRGDNKGNLCSYSQTFSNAFWNVFGTGCSKTAIVGPNGEDGAQIVFGTGNSNGLQSLALSFTAGRQYTVRATVQAVTSSTSVRLECGALPVVSADIPVGTGWQDIAFAFTSPASATSRVKISNNLAGNSGDVRVSRVWVTESTWDPDYIATTSAPAYAGLDGKPVVMFDASLGAMTGYSTTGTLEAKALPTHQFVVSRKDGGGTTLRNLIDSTDAGGRNAFGYAASTLQVRIYGGGSVVSANTTQEAWGQFTTSFLGTASSSIRRKGVTLVSGDTGAVTMTGGYFIGNSAGGSAQHNGPIASVMVVRRALTTAQRDYIESVLNTFFPSTQ